jgi:hypothetical protein
MVLCWRDTNRWHVVLVVVLVLVLDPLVSVLHPNFDCEDDDEDEKLSTEHFRHSTFVSLHSNCPAGATFFERSLGKSLVPIYLNHIMFAHDLCYSRIEYLRNFIDLNRKDRAKRFHKSSIFNLQFRLVRVGGLRLWRISQTCNVDLSLFGFRERSKPNIHKEV